MTNRFSGIRGALGALVVYTSGFLGGCTSPQVVSETPRPTQPPAQTIQRNPLPKYNFEIADRYTRMNLSYRKSENGRSKTFDAEMFDTDSNPKTVEQAVVTSREGHDSNTVMFVRQGAKVATTPGYRTEVRIMTPEDEQRFDRLFGGD